MNDNDSSRLEINKILQPAGSAPTKTQSRRGRVPTIKEEEIAPAPPISDPDTSTKAKPRSRAKRPDTTATESEADSIAAPVARTSRRGAKTPSTDEESSAPTKPVRRGTRARTQSVDPEGDSAVATDARTTKEKTTRATKRTGRSKASSDVETIVEEEEPRVMKPASRSRRVKTDSDDGVDDKTAPTVRKVGGRKATKATSLVAIEEVEDKNDKENNPDGPASPTESLGEAPTKVTKKVTRSIKPPSRSVASKLKTDDEQAAPTRTTRTRAARK